MVQVLLADKIPVQLVDLCVDVAAAFVFGDGAVIRLCEWLNAVIQKHNDHNCPGVSAVEDRHGIISGDGVFWVADFGALTRHHGAVHEESGAPDIVAQALGVSALAGAG